MQMPDIAPSVRVVTIMPVKFRELFGKSQNITERK